VNQKVSCYKWIGESIRMLCSVYGFQCSLLLPLCWC